MTHRATSDNDGRAPVITTPAAPAVTTPAAPAVTTPAAPVTTTAAPVTTSAAPAVTSTAAPVTTTGRAETSSSATTSAATDHQRGGTDYRSDDVDCPIRHRDNAHNGRRHDRVSTAVVTETSGSRTATTTSPSQSTTVQAGQTTTPTVTPKRLPVDAQNVELAKQSIPVQQNPDPAPQTEIHHLTNLLINPTNPPNGPAPNLALDKKNVVKQFDPKLVYYDEFYRPIIANPYQQPLQIVYIYQGAPRIR